MCGSADNGNDIDTAGHPGLRTVPVMYRGTARQGASARFRHFAGVHTGVFGRAIGFYKGQEA